MRQVTKLDALRATVEAETLTSTPLEFARPRRLSQARPAQRPPASEVSGSRMGAAAMEVRIFCDTHQRRPIVQDSECIARPCRTLAVSARRSRRSLRCRNRCGQFGGALPALLMRAALTRRKSPYFLRGLCRISKPYWNRSKVHRQTRNTMVFVMLGGEGGIRTPDGLAPMPHFECGAFNRSATSPRAPSPAQAGH